MQDKWLITLLSWIVADSGLVINYFKFKRKIYEDRVVQIVWVKQRLIFWIAITWLSWLSITVWVIPLDLSAKQLLNVVFESWSNEVVRNCNVGVLIWYCYTRVVYWVFAYWRRWCVVYVLFLACYLSKTHRDLFIHCFRRLKSVFLVPRLRFFWINFRRGGRICGLV